MSIHFAPQWVKPIKPSSSPLNASTDQLPSKPTLPTPTAASFPSVPFPALSGNNRSSSPNNPITPNPVLSYSRVTHTPASPGFTTDGSYFPHSDQNGENGHAGNPHPFRYSREKMLGIWDEEKVSAKPIEMMEMHEGGAILVSKGLVKPIGLRELSDIEKKLLATSVHPPMPTRRPMTAGTPGTPGTESTGTPISRRTIGSGINGRDSPGQPGGRPGGFGFARSENAFGGALGGKVGAIGSGAIGGTIDGRMPGSLGGGFGGVGRRGPRMRTESADIPNDAPRPPANVAWRPTRTASGNFEGVLGFGGSTPTPSVANTTQPTTSSSGSPATPTTSSFDHISHPAILNSVKEKEKEPQESSTVFGGGGGPGWGSGQKKWRLAAGLNTRDGERPSHILNIPISTAESFSESMAASASGTPVPERDATVLDTTPATAPTTGNGHPQLSPDPAPPTVEKEDLGAVQWYYRDPGGLEQGPFTGVQMQEWFSHKYFEDNLPLRRSAESSFYTLAELKVATASEAQPFLTAVKPQILPPNLPLPSVVRNGVQDQFSNLSIQSPGPNPGHDPRSNFSPQPTYQPYIPERHAPFSQPYNRQMPPAQGSFMPGPGQPWGAIPPTAPQGPNRHNTFGSIGIPGPIASAPLYHPQHQPLYSPVVGGPAHHDIYSPGPGAGIPASPWGVPAQPIYHPVPIPQQPSPLPAWQPPIQEQPTPAPPVDEPSYFPQTETEIPAPNAVEELAATAEDTAEESEAVIDEEDAEPFQENVPESPLVADEPFADITTPVEPIPTPKSAPVSVWGQKTSASVASSRKNSIALSPSTPTTSAITAKMPSSLPSKPLSAATQHTASTPTSEKPPTSAKTAPWAATSDKELKPTSTGPSLREIQELEAQQAEARKAVAARAAPAPSTPAAASDDIPQNLTWGLPSSGSGVKSTPAVSTPVSTPAAWGSGEAGPKKTMKQIQEEEEKRKAKARVASAAAAQQVAAGKRGYADLAGNVPTPAAVAAAGWTTVGATVKAAPTPTTATPARAVPVKATPALIPKPSTPVPAAIAKPKTNGIDENTQPSVEFIRWTKTALAGLSVPMDDFIQMLLTFPIDPPASSRPEVLEIISDSVYSNSSTLDGRRFAQEFFTRRKADAGRPGAKVGSGALSNGGGGGGKVATAADVVKIVPRKVEAEAGFKIVKAKGKKRN